MAGARNGGPIIDARGLHRVYGAGSQQVHALRGVDFVVQPGEMVAVMGASGSGKSTMMNILGCLDRPNGGSYTLDGVRTDTLSKDQLADVRNTRIGFVFQGFNLLPRTSALENVELPLLYDRTGRALDTRALALHALERVGLGDRAHHEPSELSGGQQQRVAIARAIVTQPSLLLADEPTGNLDTHTSLEVMALFQQLNAEGATIVVVTHEHDIAEYTKRVVEMRDGVVIRDEPIRNRRDAGLEAAAYDPATPVTAGIGGDA